MNKFVIFTVAIAFACLGAPAQGTFLTLDNFTAGTTDLNLTDAAPPTKSASDVQTGLSGVVGGSRGVLIEKLGGLSGSQRNVSGTVDTANQQFIYISGAGATGTLTLTYNANGAGLNIQLGLIDSILLNFVDGDYGPSRTIPVEITITAANNQTGTLTQTLAVAAGDPPVPYALEFKIADFSNLGGLDLATNSVQAVQMRFTPPATSTDFTLGTIQVVPEPPTYAMTFAGLAYAGFSFWRRRRQA
ncbi:MAG: PEP-CTERM sorting domain-containing protein [Planctomycetia bacterium]